MKEHKPERRLHPWGSLRLRLSIAVVGAVMTVIAIGIIIDHRREHRIHIDGVIASLTEQAHVLKLARASITNAKTFGPYVDEFCERMNENISPGHHIIILDRQGTMIAGSQHHSGSEVEKALLDGDPAQDILNVGGHRLAQVRLKDADGGTIIIAQYMDHMEDILRQQMISRTISAAATAVTIVVLVFLAINGWVLRPLRHLGEAARAWSERNFGKRCEASGPDGLRVLAGELNAMAQELEVHEHQRLRELEKAKRIQENLLPASLPSVSGLAIAVGFCPVDHVAGDLYDVFELPGGQTAVVILDVAGHGISAALLTGVVKMSLRHRLAEVADPAHALEVVSKELYACTPSEHFVTACVGVWDPNERTWTYAAAGHPGGVLLSNGEVRHLPSTGPLLAVIPSGEWSSGSIHLQEGDRLVLYTDGVTDAGAPNQPVGTEGLENVLNQYAHMSEADQVSAVMELARSRSEAEPEDDMTVLVLRATSDSRAQLSPR